MVVGKITFSAKQIENINQDTNGITVELNEGTPRSGKTTSDIFKMADFYLRTPDQNHLVSAYNQEQAYRMFMDGDGLGLVHIFNGCSDIRHDEHGDHLLLYTPNGEKKIYYKGGGKANSVGAITGMSLGSVTYLEYNLLHKGFIRESFRRTFAAKVRYHLAEQNPPAPNHPNLEELERFEKSGRYLFRHWTPNDNPILTTQRKKELYEELSSSQYLLDRDWYGKRVMPEGVIYSMFDSDKHTAKSIKGKVIECFFTADGGQSDATTCALNVVTWHEGKYYLYRMANYYHSGSDTGVTLAMSTYAKKIQEFVKWCYEKWDWLPRWNWFFVDPACKSLREELRLLGITTTKADNNTSDKITSNGTKIEVGIERMQNAFSKGVFFLFDITGDYDHYHFVKELGMYVRNDNGYPIDKNNHAMDECRYAINYFVKRYVI
ncbi:PBSX family phage terminase large subunit [uncultured Enterococcus sp.]|uniref:PBSX family phage terminase large subunit n=1 Tax=uncultured Enterococcus sp. TaxID=167972 RepID=UPI002AA76C95|nr:PBSX family phage terminase large subunit [uncultured Enterococcus sp.]